MKVDQIQEMAEQYMREAKSYLEERGELYSQQNIYQVAMRLLVTELWCGTQEEHETRLVAISLINQQLADFRARTGEPVEKCPVRWPAPDVMTGVSSLATRDATAKAKVTVRPDYQNPRDGVAQLLFALETAEAFGLTGYSRELWARQHLRTQLEVYTERCCEAHLSMEARQWAWLGRQNRLVALDLLADLRQGRVTEAELQGGANTDGKAM